MAVNFDGMPEDDVALWQRQLEEADRDVRFGFVSMPVLTTGVTDYPNLPTKLSALKCV